MSSDHDRLGGQLSNGRVNTRPVAPQRRPQTISGVLYCGFQDDRPTVAWTDDARLVVSASNQVPRGQLSTSYTPGGRLTPELVR
jgi:hypothetical protein